MSTEKERRKGPHLIRKNLKAIIIFEATFKLIFAFISVPFLVMIFNASIRLAGYRYLSNDNIFTYLRKPSTIAIIIFVIVAIILYFLYEMSALTGCFHASYQDIRLTATDLYRLGFLHTKRAFHPANIGIIFWILFILPVMNIVYIIGLFFLIKIPGFVYREMKRIWPILAIAVVLFVIFALVAMIYLYCIQGYVVERRSLFRGHKIDRKLMKGRYWKTGAKLLAFNALIVVLAVLIFEGGVYAAVGITKWLGVYKMMHIVALRSMNALKSLLFWFYYLGLILFNVYFVCRFYFMEKEERKEETAEFELPPQIGKHPRRLKTVIAFVVMLLMLNSTVIFSLNSEALELDAEIFQVPTVMAHRGASADAPENTMAAFELAIEEMADWIELDVQMTSDGVVVVTHDTNLKRITGLNRNVWQVTYDRIKELDAGSWYGEEFADQKIPTLEEVMELTAGKIKLNIEMKPSGHETGFEEEVIRIIREYDMTDDCMICSMKYNTLKRIKELAPDITTTYVLIMAYSNFWDVDAADAFSISYNMLSKSIIYNVKNAGKDIYAWTVNTEKDMQSVFDYGVDGIITDDPTLGQEVILSLYAPDSVVDFVSDTLVEMEEDAVLVNEEE